MLISWLALIHGVAVLVFTGRILLRDALSPAARLAWFLVMLFTPYLGVLIYVLFGEVNLGRTLHLRHEENFHRLRELAGDAMGSCARSLPGNVEAHYQIAFRAASVDGFGTTLGNRATLSPDADATLAGMVADIDAATQSVQALYYIWLDDHTGRAIAEALTRAAARGVIVHAMADGLGSRRFVGGTHWRAMRKAGVHLSIALPIKWVIDTILFSRLDLRNHRKITVIDSRITWCGSQNCADPAFAPKAKYGPWVDIMLRFEGPVVAQCQLLFAADWLLNTGEPLPDTLPIGAPPIEGGFPAQLFADGPTQRRGATPQLFATLLTLARGEVIISTPYFVPDNTVINALCGAASRGVLVTLILPMRNDSRIVAAASRSYYRRLLQAGVQICEFRGGLLHAKTLTVDRALSLVGSTNLDMRSFDLNYENDILLRDDDVTQAIRERQQTYLAQSVPVTLAQVRDWSYPRRMWNNVIATIGPIL